jgi:peroxiredoxin
VLLGAAVLIVAIVLVLQTDAGPPPVVRGVTAPGFVLPRLTAGGSPDQGLLSLAELEGRVVLVNFWATWCAPCESEMPAMERLYRALPRDGFELMAVSIDGIAADVEGFQARYQLSFPILLDRDQAVYKLYQTMGVPESLLIDQRGRIVERYVGPREWDAAEYVERIRDLIGSAGSASVPGPAQL